jgi:hypothetical protein
MHNEAMHTKKGEGAWREWATPEELAIVAYCEQARRDATDDIRVIRKRCYMRANRNGPCKQDENNDASD